MLRRVKENYLPRQDQQARRGRAYDHLSDQFLDRVLGYLAHKKGGLRRLNKAVKQARSNHARRTIAIGVSKLNAPSRSGGLG